jgi:hypothetical protein
MPLLKYKWLSPEYETKSFPALSNTTGIMTAASKQTADGFRDGNNEKAEKKRFAKHVYCSLTTTGIKSVVHSTAHHMPIMHR